jgi:hypothetical protein
MTALGYVLRRSLFVAWRDDHSAVFRGECWREYRLGPFPLFRRSLCRRTPVGSHEGQYVGHRHVLAVSVLRLLWCFLLGALLGLWMRSYVRAVEAEALRQSAPGRISW